jgi:hypothetical protein
MNDILVGFNAGTNNITINSQDVFDITAIRSIFDATTPIGNPDNMKLQQQILNYLDSIKDGTNVNILQQLNMYPEVNGIWPSFPNDLHLYENNIKAANISNISNITWTKLKKRQALTPPLPIQNIFRDCGIGADVFIAPGFKLFSTFATYIDPATRASADIVWPRVGQTITFSEKSMDLFGLVESTLKSKTISKTRFDYDIMTHNNHFKNNGVIPDINMGFFEGNTNKNTLLKKANTKVDTKKALISLKEWGDKMQVIMLLIWTKLNVGQTYTMITCDKVVYTLCMLLKVKCIFTGQINVGNIRKYSIEIYEPSTDPIGDAIKRYNSTKSEIISENKAFISMINLLKLNPTQSIYIDGVTEPITIKKEFYEKVFTDIYNIQTALVAIPNLTPSTTNTLLDIEVLTKQLKMNFLLLPFIRKIKNRIKLLRGINYTSIIRNKPSFDNSKDSFYNIIIRRGFKTQVPIIRRRTLGGGPQKSPSKAKSVDNKFGKISRQTPNENIRAVLNITNIPAVFDSNLFNDSDFYDLPIYYTDYQVTPVDRETDPMNQFIDHVKSETTIDLNETLRNQVRQIAINNNYRTFFDSIYSSVLISAYIENGIPLDYTGNIQQQQSQLFGIIANIIDPNIGMLDIQPVVPRGPMIPMIPTYTTPLQPIGVATGGGKKKRKSKKKKSKKKKNKKKTYQKKHN